MKYMFKYSLLLLALIIGVVTYCPNYVSAETVPQTNWQLQYVDSEELIGENGAANNAFDGNPATIWHSEWKLTPAPLPHEIQIDLGTVYNLEGFRYLPRQDGGVNGTIGQYRFYVSTDGINWGSPVKEGTFASNLTQKEVLFPSTQGRFVRMVAVKEINNKVFTSVAEFNVLGTLFTGNLAPESTIDNPLSNIIINQSGSVDFTGTGADPDNDTPLSYRWNFGDPAIADAVVEAPGLITFSNTGTYTVTFTVTDSLGNIDPTPASRTVTVLNGMTNLIPQTNWQLQYVDSEELIGENGAATNAFDGNPATIWHSEWKLTPAPLPHEIQIDLGTVYNLEGFRYLPRQDGGVNGTIGQYKFYVSTDGINWGSPVKEGTFASNLTQKEVLFPSTQGRFVRLVAVKEINNKVFTSVAEFNVLGTLFTGNLAPESTIDNPASNITINQGESVDFTGTGADPDNDTPLTYRWTFGDPSIADAVVEAPGLITFANTGTYTVTFTVTDSLGNIDPTPASRSVTVLNSTTSLIPQTNWQLQYVDSEELIGENGAATNAFDGIPETIWHTEWKLKQPPLPHEIQIDLGAVYNLDGFYYLPRQDGGINGTIGQYRFYVSTDGINWGSPVKEGTFANNLTQKEVLFPSTPGRFVCLVALKEINNKVFTSVAELNVLGSIFTGNLAPNSTIDSPASNIIINQGASVNFTGTGADPNNNAPLTYRWNFGDPTIADAVVEDPGLVKFNNAGTYTVSFTATDRLGAIDPTPAFRGVTVKSNLGRPVIVPDWSSVNASPLKIADPEYIHNPVLTASDVTDVPATFVADPFLFQEAGVFYLFFEVLNSKNNLGQIGVASSSDTINWTYDRIVLSESFHLSYPYIFTVDGKHYMIPETNEAQSVRIYEATNFPYGWKLLATLLNGQHFVDPSIVYYNNYWWMFVGVAGTDDCHLYYSQDLLSGWIEHPKSPIVVSDPAHSRPAGRVFVFNGNRVIRPVQQTDVWYIKQVRAYEVDILTTTAYAEHEVAESPVAGSSGVGWNAAGSHQYDPVWIGDHWVAAIDGRYSSSYVNWAIGIYATPRTFAPDSIIDEPITDISINAGETITFSGSGTDPNNKTPLAYLWHFGDGSGVPDHAVKSPGLIQFNKPGQYTVKFTVENSNGEVDSFPATKVITVLDGTNNSLIPHTNWKLKYVDSQELVAENGAAINAFDDNPSTIWHTEYKLKKPPLPHEIQIDLGSPYMLRGFRYLPRQDGGINGTIFHYAFFVSADGINWGSPVKQGDFSSGMAEKEVFFPSVSCRFVRLQAIKEINNNFFTSIAELNFLGELAAISQ